MFKLIIINVLFPVVPMACALAVQSIESIAAAAGDASQSSSPANSGFTVNDFGNSFVEISLYFQRKVNHVDC